MIVFVADSRRHNSMLNMVMNNDAPPLPPAHNANSTVDTSLHVSYTFKLSKVPLIRVKQTKHNSNLTTRYNSHPAHTYAHAHLPLSAQRNACTRVRAPCDARVRSSFRLDDMRGYCLSHCRACSLIHSRVRARVRVHARARAVSVCQRSVARSTHRRARTHAHAQAISMCVPCASIRPLFSLYVRRVRHSLKRVSFSCAVRVCVRQTDLIRAHVFR
jgi:hypothetical protein